MEDDGRQDAGKAQAGLEEQDDNAGQEKARSAGSKQKSSSERFFCRLGAEKAPSPSI